MADRGTAEPAPGEHLVRHAPIDRIYHWLMAASVLVLVGTGFLPVIGVKFSWVVPHWIAGLILILVVLFHIAWAVRWQKLKQMGVGPRDIGDLLATFRAVSGRSDAPPPKSGKYLLAQRLYHHAIAVTVLATCVTGGLMLVKQDTPIWKRDPYWLSDGNWGIIYVVHGLASIAVLSLILIHVYFAIRPEKLFYTRSMIKGWITRREFEAHHDRDRWNADKTAP